MTASSVGAKADRVTLKAQPEKDGGYWPFSCCFTPYMMIPSLASTSGQKRNENREDVVFGFGRREALSVLISSLGLGPIGTFPVLPGGEASWAAARGEGLARKIFGASWLRVALGVKHKHKEERA